jgi:hypothetical protein
MICEICFKQPASQRHHLYSQSKRARAHYGHLIDEPFNLLPVCADCHMTKPLPKYSEHQFRQSAKENGYSLPDKMKSCKREDL